MKFTITITAEYADPLNAERMVEALREKHDLGETLRPGIGERLIGCHVAVDWVRPVPPKGTVYVVLCHGKPVASCSSERLAEYYVDHADEPQHCSIEEVESD